MSETPSETPEPEATYIGEADAPGFTGDAAAHAADVEAHDHPIEHDELGNAIVGGLVSGGIGAALGHGVQEWVVGEGVVAAGELATHDHHVATEETSHGAEEQLGDPYGGTLPPGGAPAGTYIGEADDANFVHGGQDQPSQGEQATYIGEADDANFVHGGDAGATLPADDGEMPPDDIGYIAAPGEGS